MSNCYPCWPLLDPYHLAAMRGDSFPVQEDHSIPQLFDIYISPPADCWWAGCWWAGPGAGWGSISFSSNSMSDYELTETWSSYSENSPSSKVEDTPSTLASLSAKHISKALWAEILFAILNDCGKEPHMQSYLFVVSLPQFAPGWGRVWENTDCCWCFEKYVLVNFITIFFGGEASYVYSAQCEQWAYVWFLCPDCHVLTSISVVLYLFSMVRAWVGWAVYVCFSVFWGISMFSA